MKKVLTLLAVTGLLSIGSVSNAHAKTAKPVVDSTAYNDSVQLVAAQAAEAAAQAEADAKLKAEADAAALAAKAKADEPKETDFDMIQTLKEKFIEGDPRFMSLVLICLIIGLALAIERIIFLTMATSNNKALIEKVEEALNSGGVEAAKEVCRNTRGPVASIFYQGLERSSEGIDMVEKSVVAYGSVQMGLLEKNLSWISLFIALAPMLGFFGTVIGMIGAFDAIAAANNISPGIVATGIGVALITTVSGLLVAMVLQVFYNYIIAKVDSIVNDMEDASITLIDLLIKHQK